MQELLLHTTTAEELNSFITNPQQPLGLFGPTASGKAHIAQQLAKSLTLSKTITNNANIFILRPSEKGSITIDDTRQLINYFKLKNVGGYKVAVIEDADLLTVEAQNALLKTIEEPSTNNVVILTATSQSSLLPTIVSRIKQIDVKPVTYTQLTKYVSNDTPEMQRAWMIANGRLGLFYSLLNNESHDLLPYIELAKQVLRATPYERLLLVDAITKQDVSQFLEALQIVSNAAFKQAVQNKNNQTTRLHTIRRLALQTQESLILNANTKLSLTDLMLNI